LAERAASRKTEGYQKRGFVERADGTRLQRFCCKQKDCPGKKYVPVDSNGNAIGLTEGEVGCNHEPLMSLGPRTRIAPSTRVEIDRLHAAGSKPAAIRQELLERGIPVSKNDVKAVVESRRDTLSTLTEQLQQTEGVETVSIRFRGIAGLFVSVCFKGLLLAAGMACITHIFVDGTRSIGPHGTQVVTILGLLACGTVIPLAFMVTQGATSTHYEFLADSLKHHGLNPKYIHLDFEVAEHNAVRKVWPGARLVGCVFHFMQACLRKWRKLFGARHNDVCWPATKAFLQRAYSSTSKTDLAVHLTGLQAYLVANHREAFWNYFAAQWLVKIPPTLWTLIGGEVDLLTAIRTNNYAEGFNNFMKQIIFDCRKFLNLATVCERLYGILKAKLTELTTRDPAVVAGLIAARNVNTVAAALTQVAQDVQEGAADQDEDVDLDAGQDDAARIERIREIEAEFNVQMVNTVTDGRCQQGALGAAHGRGMNAATLVREEIANELMTNVQLREHVEGFLVEGLEGTTIDEFVERLRTTATWGNHVTLIAYATRHRAHIHVHYMDGRDPVVIQPVNGVAVEGR
jgi:hypothetical protein